jgi:hypothetical protein
MEWAELHTNFQCAAGWGERAGRFQLLRGRDGSAECHCEADDRGSRPSAANKSSFKTSDRHAFSSVCAELKPELAHLVGWTSHNQHSRNRRLALMWVGDFGNC